MKHFQANRWWFVFSLAVLVSVFFGLCGADARAATPTSESSETETGGVVRVASDVHKRVCLGGHEYWSCDSDAVDRHAPRTCSRPKCGQTFSHCQNNGTACVGGWHAKFGGSGPGSSTLNPENTDTSTVVCGNPNTGSGACASAGQTPTVDAHKATCLAGHEYWSCNASAFATHSKHTAADALNPVVCPADRWTDCGGTVSHATTCPAGHDFYTCNAAAVASHGTHTAPDPVTPEPDPVTPEPDPVTPPETGSVACGNPNTGPGACSAGGTATTKYAHQTTCLAGHTYWSCNANAVVTHGTHTAPAPETPEPDPQTPMPTPPETGSVACGNPNTGPGACSAGGTATTKYAHQTTCPAGHTYWSCNANAVVTHSTHTAPDPVNPNPVTPPETGSVACGNPNTGPGACSAGGTATTKYAHQTTCPAGHTYWSCNAAAVSTHSTHTASPSPNPPPEEEDDEAEEEETSPGLCGANGWTNCGGAAGAHDAVCLAGHSYYTCNASAVSTHSTHTASPSPSPNPPPEEEDDEQEESSPGLCGANGWTNCGGAAGAHDAVCGKGHSYYTCNSSAVAHHSKH